MFMSTRYKKRDPAWRRRHLFSIEDSLARLFECLTIEYSCGKLISPKYKHFKSQKIDFEQKTRLNNAIWRAWHIQYKLCKRARFFMFDPPFSDQTVHSTPQAVILEGKYWKKRLDTVSREYKKWRRFYTFKFVSSAEAAGDTDPELSGENIDDDEYLDNEDYSSDGDKVTANDIEMRNEELFFDSFAAASDLPDTLFSSLESQRGVAFGRSGGSLLDSSSIIQPTLDMLNPCFDELIDNFDWLAPELSFGRPLDPVEEVPNKEGIEMMHIDEQPILERRGLSTPEKDETSLDLTIRDESIGAEPSSLHPHRSFFDDVRFARSTEIAGENSVVGTSTSFQYGLVKGAEHSACSIKMVPTQRRPSLPSSQEKSSSGTSRLLDSTHSQSQELVNLLNRSRTQSAENVDSASRSAPVSRVSNVALSPFEHLEPEGRDQCAIYQSPAKVGTYAELPPQLQAPNLTAHLQAVLASREPNSIPRNKSDTQLSLLDNADSVRSPGSRKTSLTRKDAGLGKSKRAKIIRNVSDSNLSQMVTETAKASRRQTQRSNSLNNDGNKILPKNLSDTNLVGMTSAQHHRRILPKNYVTIVPLTNAAVLTAPSAPVTVSYVPVYPGQGPTYVVNRQTPGNNEPGTARLYMPKTQTPISSVSKSVSPKVFRDRASSTIQTVAEQISSSSSGKAIQAPARIYQLAKDGKNILPFTGFTGESVKPFQVCDSAGLTSVLKDGLSDPQLSGHPIKDSTSTVLSQVLYTVSSTLPSTTVVTNTVAGTSKAGTEVVMPLQGLTTEQLIDLAKLLQSTEGQATLAYLELLQQQLTNLLTQQQQQIFKAQQQQQIGTNSSLQTNAATTSVNLLQGDPQRALEQLMKASTSVKLMDAMGAIQRQDTADPRANPVVLPTNQQLSVGRVTHQQSVPMVLSNVFVDKVPIQTQRSPTAAEVTFINGPRVKVTPLKGTMLESSTMLRDAVRPRTNTETESSSIVDARPIIPQTSTSSILSTLLRGTTQCLTGHPQFAVARENSITSGFMMNTTSGSSDCVSASGELRVGGESEVIDSSHADLRMAVKIEESQASSFESDSSFSISGTAGIGKHVDKEKKRMSHISAEKRRRGNIKNSFDMLMQMIPSIQNERSAKISKASMLEKAAEYVLYLHRERDKNKDRIDALTKDIAELNTAISTCQSQLPATGASMYTKSMEEMQSSYFSYIKEKITADHRYWIFTLMLKPLFNSFTTHVTTGSLDEFVNSVQRWLDQYCGLPTLRPAVLASLRDLSTSTSFLKDPSQLPLLAEQATRSEDPTSLKPSIRRPQVEPAVIENPATFPSVQDTRSTLETPYAWTVQFSRVPPSKPQSDPT